jgi:hypothetical protein
VLPELPELVEHELGASKVSGRPKRCELDHAFLWECSCKRLKLDQLLGQLGVCLTLASWSASKAAYNFMDAGARSVSYLG